GRRHHRSRQGQERRGAARAARRGARAGPGRQYDQAPYPAGGRADRRHRREGSGDPHLQCRPYRPEIEQADARRLQGAWRRPQGALCQALRRSPRRVRAKTMRTRLQEQYEKEVRPALMKEFGYGNPMQVPKLDKIVINMGVGEGTQDGKKVDAAASDLAVISGQKAVVTRAKKSIATFKLRENLPIGCKVTLRRQRMYEFLDRLIHIA